MLENHVENETQNEAVENNDKSVQIRVRRVQPDVDIEESKEDYILNVDMPGVLPEAIDVKLDKEVLTVEGQAEIEGLAPRHYYRQFRVMRGLDVADCRADYRNGVLTLHLAKPRTSQPQQIKISCEG